MSQHFNLDTLGSFKSEKHYKKSIKEKVVLPQGIGCFNIEKTKINNDIFLFKMGQNINQNITIESKNKNVFFINIILDGIYEYKSDFSKNINLLVQKGGTINCFVNEEKGLHIRNANNPYKSLGVVIKDEFLEENLFSKIDDFKAINNQPMNIFKNELTNIKTQICANELFYMEQEDTLQNIYMESKVLEIIYNEFSDILNMQKNPSLGIKLDGFDVQALQKAKEILINNMQNPPSIKELAKLVSLNEFKLKKGFKEKFKITPYKLLEKYRMEKAKYLLENEDMNVNEISQAIGYKYQNNFAKVFKQYYKISPKDIMKIRKYYY